MKIWLALLSLVVGASQGVAQQPVYFDCACDDYTLAILVSDGSGAKTIDVTIAGATTTYTVSEALDVDLVAPVDSIVVSEGPTAWTVICDREVSYQQVQTSIAESSDSGPGPSSGFEVHVYRVSPTGTVTAVGSSDAVTVNRPSNGIYDFTFVDNPPTTLNYFVTAERLEPDNLRDDVPTMLTQRTLTGFRLVSGEQDNGGTAGVPVNRELTVLIIK